MNGTVSEKTISDWLVDEVQNDLCSVEADLVPFLSNEDTASLPFIDSEEMASAYLRNLIHCHENPNARAVIEDFLPTPVEEISVSLVTVGRRFPALQIAILNEQYNLVNYAKRSLCFGRIAFPINDIDESVRAMTALRLFEVLSKDAQAGKALKLAMSCAVVAEDQIRGDGVTTGEPVDWHTPPDWILHPYAKNEHNQRSKVRYYDLFAFYRGLILQDHPQAVIKDDKYSSIFCEKSVEYLASLGADAVESRKFKDITNAMRNAAVRGEFGH